MIGENILYGISQDKYDQLLAETEKIELPAVWNGSEWISIKTENDKNDV